MLEKDHLKQPVNQLVFASSTATNLTLPELNCMKKRKFGEHPPASGIDSSAPCTKNGFYVYARYDTGAATRDYQCMMM